MTWNVEFEDDFELEFLAFDSQIRIALLAASRLLKDYGPRLGRPHADTLKGSRFPNMKELRFEAMNGEWRAAFAFDPNRNGIIIVAGDKSGVSSQRFYKQLISKADQRFTNHLMRLAQAKLDRENGQKP